MMLSCRRGIDDDPAAVASEPVDSRHPPAVIIR
jgi:hypothetical protein